jgi:hypothetical protein
MSNANSKSKNPWIFVVKNTDGHLVPFANYDREKFDELALNKVLRVNIAQQRSQPRHRLYRVVLRQVVKNTDLFVDEDSLHKTLLLGCGVVEPVMTVDLLPGSDRDGEIMMIPSSTAFDAMKEDTFKAYFDQALNIIGTNIIPGVDIEALLAESRKEANYKEAA